MRDKFFLDIRDPDLTAKIQPLTEAINGEEPLPCALIGAAYIDKCLLGLLESHFRKSGTADTLLASDKGLIGSLYSRAQMAYLLELISNDTLNNIRLICGVRNLFAHSHTPLTFESAEIRKLCAELKQVAPQMQIGDAAATAFFEALDKLPRQQFTRAVMSTIMALMMLPAVIAARKDQQ